MLRRTVFAALSAAAAPFLIGAAATPAVAQAAGGLSDAQYRARTLRLGTLSKLSSEAALTRTARPEVRQFARFEVAEQTTVARVLTDRENPPPAPLFREEQALLARLRSLSGAAFDRAYVQAQTTGHRQLRVAQRGYLQGGGNGNLRDIARLVDTVIGEHLAHLRTLERLLQG